ncbi:hypothetical protein [Fontibacillus sp. BL9]|uniref:hypothetical protein n=1 Tax=Fontibacillus sp. BL9 TaxID=3389971 RepID=UPI00397DF814
MLQDDVAAIIKRRWNLPESFDALVKSYIDEAGAHIANYIGRDRVDEIPTALVYTWANIAMGAFRAEQSHLPEMDVILASGVDLKIGDTSVKESSGGGTGAGTLLMFYATDLNRYRRMRWNP